MDLADTACRCSLQMTRLRRCHLRLFQIRRHSRLTRNSVQGAAYRLFKIRGTLLVVPLAIAIATTGNYRAAALQKLPGPAVFDAFT